ncbi:MAG: class I SAM-dependent methyltransferase, partial [Leptospiraceae bacterium]|nr:class I SAM-dependent methyltransferase [Leptospiraceae bacterium]
MTQFRMPDSAQKAEFVKKNFDVISKKYDRFNDLNSFFLHRLWKNEIVKQIRSYFFNQDVTCLDLCCGTGDIALRISKIPNVSKVYGVDFSERMLEIANARKSSNSKLEFQIGDATNLSQFANNSFDVVSIGFG